MERHARPGRVAAASPKAAAPARLGPVLLALLAAAACLGACADEGAGRAPLAEGSFELRAWGTAVAFQGSDGVAVPGVGRAEAPLPAFVLAPAPAGATLALEAAVLVRTEGQGALDLAVSLPGGALTAAFPPPATPLPAAEAAFSLDVGDPRAALEALPEPGPWPVLRGVGGATVASASAAERFVYLSGAADGDLGVRVTSDGVGTVRVEPTGPEPIPAAWYAYVHEGGGLLLPLGPLDGPRTFLALPTPKEQNLDLFSAEARARLVEGLGAAGLAADEAAALVDTWAWSVLRTHGRRLLVVLPEGRAGALLPLETAPAPAARARVLVGRVELMLPDDEAALLADLEDARVAGSGAALLAGLGPFAEPRLRRARALLEDGDPRVALCEALLAEAAAGGR